MATPLLKLPALIPYSFNNNSRSFSGTFLARMRVSPMRARR